MSANITGTQLECDHCGCDEFTVYRDDASEQTRGGIQLRCLMCGLVVEP